MHLLLHPKTLLLCIAP